MWQVIQLLNFLLNFTQWISLNFRPFVVTSIPFSNLILLVADKNCENKSVQFNNDDHPVNVTYTYDESLHCRKISYSPLYRKPAKFCFNRTVSDIFWFLIDSIWFFIIFQENLPNQRHLCGAGHRFTQNLLLVLLASSIQLFESTKMLLRIVLISFKWI